MRRFVLPVALLIGALALAGCSSDDSSSSAGDSSGEMKHDMHGSDGQSEENRPVIAGAPELEVTADAYSFTPKALQLTAGQGVNIALTSVDLEHDIFVKGVGHVAHAPARATTRAGLRIDESGTFRFWCTVKGHKADGMVGTITVT